MAHPVVRTLTLNPSIDLSSDVDAVRPLHKLRTRNGRMDPGGGGINVARVLQRLGIEAEALFLAGGATGAVLDDLMDRHCIRRQLIPISEDTRMSHTIHECSTGSEFRFVPEGPCIAEEEVGSALEVAEQPCDYFVASGSVPRRAPEDIYAQLSQRFAGTGAKFILDTSGPELARTLDAGRIFMIKPSRGELEDLAGKALPGLADLAGYAGELVSGGKVELVAVTLGRDGAMLINRDGALSLPAVPVETRSAVGAGDSFLAAFVFGLASGRSSFEAFRLAAAAGAAAALTPGTDLCRAEDVWRLLEQVPEPTHL